MTVGLLERSIKTLPSVKFVNLYSVSEVHDVSCSDLSLWYSEEKVNRIFKSCHCNLSKNNLTFDTHHTGCRICSVPL